ncbi:hypothetical protein LWI28_005049 [Acer negundo]|uniref:Uncharacterized protein n=1 Tax=Acer negundo TaxID=4023 RepID=A0AAD5I558_ACENE|nr:hypothetical protein LWI28_005049 [Acer negundo]
MALTTGAVTVRGATTARGVRSLMFLSLSTATVREMRGNERRRTANDSCLLFLSLYAVMAKKYDMMLFQPLFSLFPFLSRFSDGGAEEGGILSLNDLTD